jgi:hypothetical protein
MTKEQLEQRALEDLATLPGEWTKPVIHEDREGFAHYWYAYKTGPWPVKMKYSCARRLDRPHFEAEADSPDNGPNYTSDPCHESALDAYVALKAAVISAEQYYARHMAMLRESLEMTRDGDD